MSFIQKRDRTGGNKKSYIETATLTTLISGAMLLSLGQAAATSAATASYGGLDPAFGVGGKVTTDFGTDSDAAHAVLVQPDGKIVAAGEGWYFVPGRNENRPKFTIARYNTNGTLDTGFGDGGKTTTTFIQDDLDYSIANAIARQPDGKLLAAGSAENLDAGKSTFALARYNADGSLDSSFGQNGLVLTPVRDKISFDDKDEAHAIIVQPDGKIVLAGNTGGYGQKDFALARYNTNGTLDTGFGEEGVQVLDANGNNDELYAVALQSDGKIVAGGLTSAADNDDFAVLRLNADGSVDTGFSDGGLAGTDFLGGADRVNGLAVRPDGKIIAGGYASLEFPEPCPDPPCTMFGFAMVQYNTNGSLDTSFGEGGKAQGHFNFTTIGNAMVRLADGRLVIGGVAHTSDSSTTTNDFGLSVYNADGSLDASFGNGGVIATNFAPTVDSGDRINALAIQPDGKVVAAGVGAIDSLGIASDFALARYNVSLGSGQPTATPTHSGTGSTPTATRTTVSGGATATAITTATANPTGTPGSSCALTFTDVPQGSTFYSYVHCLACQQILGGYSDGTFRPGKNVTRGQLAKIVSNAAGFTEAVTGQTFTDVAPGSTFYPYVERMAGRGIIGGYSNGTFRPNNNATRGQIAKIAANAAGFTESVSGQTFTDVAPNSAFYPYVERMARRGIIGGYSDGTFRPSNNATRGQTAKIVSSAFFPDCH